MGSVGLLGEDEFPAVMVELPDEGWVAIEGSWSRKTEKLETKLSIKYQYIMQRAENQVDLAFF